MTPKELERNVRELLAQPVSDEELRSRLEQLANDEISFSGLTWLWGPLLYKRNRVFFRPFVSSKFSTYMQLPKWKVEVIKWKNNTGQILDEWFREVDLNDDVELFKKLYEWKLSNRYDWKLRDKRSEELRAELISRLRNATSPAQRQIVFRKFSIWFDVDEETALQLYQIDRAAAGPFILSHLKISFFSGEAKRALWSRLLKAAEEAKDEDFRWKLYRRQIPLEMWIQDALAVCDLVRDNAELVRELEKRHLEGWGLNLADGFYQLVQKRGRDLLPYIMRHLRQVWGGWFGRGKYGKMADFAREQGWWDLWSALIRTCAGSKEFNKEISQLLENATLSDEEIRKRLFALGGVSREWNWGGFGFASIHPLDEPVALRFYERFPDILRGPFKVHVQTNLWGKNYSKLLKTFIAKTDEEMVDYMASRLITRYGRWGNTKDLLEGADELATYYGALKSDETKFSRRAAGVLSQVPAYTIFNYNQLVRENRLARLLFERSVSAYLSDPASMADLIEGAEIHVMAIAYRALVLNDDRAKRLAVEHLPLLLGTLLRPLHRDTRILAFGALANAATTLDSAKLILSRARDALLLPDSHYPKEKLLMLIATLLHRWPELRTTAEQPVVYERAA